MNTTTMQPVNNIQNSYTILNRKMPLIFGIETPSKATNYVYCPKLQRIQASLIFSLLYRCQTGLGCLPSSVDGPRQSGPVSRRGRGFGNGDQFPQRVRDAGTE